MIPSQCSGLKDPAQIIAAVWIQSLAWEIPYATGAAIKKIIIIKIKKINRQGISHENLSFS